MKEFMEMDCPYIEESCLKLYELSNEELVRLFDDIPDYSYIENYDYECMGKIENELFQELESRTDIRLEDFKSRDYILYGVRDSDGYHCQLSVSKEEFDENLSSDCPYEYHIDEECDIDGFVEACLDKLCGVKKED